MKKQCKCKECGRSFNFGDEADNEEICLRCERELLLLDEIDYEEIDLSETNREL